MSIQKLLPVWFSDFSDLILTLFLKSFSNDRVSGFPAISTRSLFHWRMNKWMCEVWAGYCLLQKFEFSCSEVISKTENLWVSQTVVKHTWETWLDANLLVALWGKFTIKRVAAICSGCCESFGQRPWPYFLNFIFIFFTQFVTDHLEFLFWGFTCPNSCL